MKTAALGLKLVYSFGFQTGRAFAEVNTENCWITSAKIDETLPR